MTQLTNTLRSFRPSWPAVLLFTALLAQAPHAAAVFVRIAPHEAQWEVATSFLGAWVYAVALEGATAYFVWRSKLRWAISFAAFSVAHNVAYYMPLAWEVDVFGAILPVRYIFSALLISASLPIAIAAFSHVQASAPESPAPIAPDAAKTPTETPATANTTTTTPVAPPRPATPRSEATSEATEPNKLTPTQRRAHIAEQELFDAAQVVAQFGVSLRTAQADIAQVRGMTTQRNGKAVHA